MSRWAVDFPWNNFLEILFEVKLVERTSKADRRNLVAAIEENIASKYRPTN